MYTNMTSVRLYIGGGFILSNINQGALKNKVSRRDRSLLGVIFSYIERQFSATLRFY
jgi:hypothetical protein